MQLLNLPGGQVGLGLPISAELAAYIESRHEKLKSINGDPRTISDLLGGEQRLKAVLAALEGSNAINTMGNVPENLEMYAHHSLWGRNDLRFLRMVPTVPAASVIHEFEIVESYGAIGGPLFTSEGTLGTRTALSSRRVTNKIVTLQHINKVTGTAQDQKTISVLGATRSLESNREAIMRLHMLKKSIAMVFGDTTTTASQIHWKGILQLFREGNTSAAYSGEPWSLDPVQFVDKRGARLNRSDIEDGGVYTYESAWGQLNFVLMDPATSAGFQGDLEKFSTTYGYAMERVAPNEDDGNGLILGNTVSGVRHQGGVATFLVDNAISSRYSKAEWKDTPEPGAPGRPAAPGAAELNANANSRFEAADLDGGNAVLRYKLQAVNDDGYSEASPATAAVLIQAGDSIRVSWESRPDALAYRILRNTAAKPGVFYEIAVVPNSGANLTYDDHNWFIPGGRWAIGLEMLSPRTRTNRLGAKPAENAVRMAVLKEMQAERLAKIGDFEWEMIVERCCPELVQPKRTVVWYNIGDR